MNATKSTSKSTLTTMKKVAAVTLAAATLAGAATHAQAYESGWMQRGSWGTEAGRPGEHGAGVYAPGEALKSGEVFVGRVVATRLVKIENGKSNLAETAVGGLIGGALGSQIGGGKGKVAATALGAILGGTVGDQIGDRIGEEQAQEVIVRLPSDRMISVVQAHGERVLERGEEVFVVKSNNGNWRVW